MSLRSRSTQLVSTFMVAAIVALSASLCSAQGIAIGQKCEAHAQEWERLQADKKFSLEHVQKNGSKQEVAEVVAYYANKEALLLRKMFLCDHCRDKQGTLGDLPSTGGGDAGKNGPGKIQGPTEKLELVGVLERAMTVESRAVAADRSHPTFQSQWNNRRISVLSIIKIDGEEMELDNDTGVFTGVTRGHNKTGVQPHAVGAKIYLVKRHEKP